MAAGPGGVALNIGTIAEPRQLASARVLVQGLQSHHDAQVTVLLLDEGNGTPEVAGAQVVRPRDLGWSSHEVEQLILGFSPEERRRILSPRLLRELLEGNDHAVYVDPQLWAVGPLGDVAGLARERSVVLVPRTLRPVPRDGLCPSADRLAQVGMADPAFVAVGATSSARAVLDWWEECATGSPDCLDQVPWLFQHDHVIVRDPGWDVGQWNLTGRVLSKGPRGQILVDGHPVAFFNFEGFSPDRPHLLSTGQSPRPRVLFSANPLLRELCTSYAARLVDAGHAQQSDATIPFTVVDGIPIDDRVRHLVRQEMDRPEPGVPTFEGLREWLAAPGALPEPLRPLGRYLSDLYLSRPDLQATYPEVMEGQLSGLLAWAEAFGAPERLPAELVQRARDAAPADRPEKVMSGRTSPGRAGTGVTVVGYLTAELGLGQSARMLVRGLESAGIPLETATYTRTTSRLDAPWVDRRLPDGVESDIAIVCINADHLSLFAREGGHRFMRARHVVGVWFWELNEFPLEMRSALDLVDEIWVGSEFAAETLRAVSDTPVHVLPQPVHAPVETGFRPRELSDLDGTYTFGFVFDYLSVFERKNPIGLVAAFRQAFPEPGESALVVKSINADKRPEERERLLLATQDRPDIVLIERYLPREELDGLMWGMDCFVSMHRAEGFGFTMAESMAIGKPVIATGYSGNLTFMHPGNSRLVRHRLVRVPPGNDPYPVTSMWAEPSVRHAGRLMRKVMEDPELAQKIGTRAARTISRRHSPNSMAQFALDRVSDIRASR